MSPGWADAQDAYGAILLDHLEGRDAYEVIERDDGTVWAGTPDDYFAPHRRWPAAERGALRAARGRVLDIGCGAGRVSRGFVRSKRHGHVVVGYAPTTGLRIVSYIPRS